MQPCPLLHFATHLMLLLPFVCILNLLLVLGIKKYFKESRMLDVILLVISGCTFIMTASSACRIGLLPPELLDRIHMIGNAAGEGARIAVLNEAEYDRSAGLHERVEFLELAADPDFNDTYVDELLFVDESEYQSV